MILSVGKRFMNRAGARLRVIERIDSGHKYFDRRPIYLFVCVVERFANGRTPESDEAPCRVCVRDDGHWAPNVEHDLDLVAEVA